MKDKKISVRVAPLALLLGLSLVGGCNGTATPTPSATPTATPTATPAKTVEVGGVTDNTAGTGFRTLKASGDTVGYATIGQSGGAYHTWGAVKVRSPINPSGMNVAFTVTNASDGTVLATNADSAGIGPLISLNADGDAFTNVGNGSTGMAVPMCTGSACKPLINGLIGKQITLKMSVKDSTGRTGSDQVTVTLTGSPLP